MNALAQLMNEGQAFWYDNIRRGMLKSGELKKMVKNDGLRGVTSNPTIFEKAISGSTDYDAAIKALVAKKKSNAEIFDQLVIDDIRQAADVFAPLYKKTKGADGFVSIEVAASLAYDTEGTVREARRLWKAVDRPNIMVKIPATKEGVAAIEQCLSEGININITLIFSIERYSEVIDAYLNALEKRAAQKKSLDVASVASFFVSRIDTTIDKILQDRIPNARSSHEKDAMLELMGKVAIANAKVAYQLFLEKFRGEKFQALKEKGARVQRPLWASTGTKNPNYSDVLYIEELIGPDTVNTMPPATVEAFRDHGKTRPSLTEKIEEARDTLSKLRLLGIDLGQITAHLEKDGVKQFADSYEKLIQNLAAKKEMIEAGNLARQTLQLGAYEDAVKKAADQWQGQKLAERLWAKDAALWSQDAGVQASIRNRLGWVNLATSMSDQAERLASFANEIRRHFEAVVLLGMGGSSLCPEVCRLTYGSKKGYPKLFVLDSTDPGAVLAVEKAITPAKSLFIVASKSGGTLESTSLFQYFYAKVAARKKDRAGENFVAITDPNTSLEKLAHEKKFRKVFPAPEDVGGRYSALTPFGLVPLACLGVDVKTFLDRAERMTHACASCVPPRDNPGVKLGVALGTLAREGRDKVTFFLSPGIASFGLWVEQLIAESTGKLGKGIVPVESEAPAPAEIYGKDRVFVSIALEKQKSKALEAKLKELQAQGHPVIQITLNDTLDLAQEFLRWEVATAVAGAVMGLNPFDEPNVTESKQNTQKVLENFRQTGRLPEAAPSDEPLHEFLSQVRPGDYVAIMAYVTPNKPNEKALQDLRHRVRDLTRAATTLGYGPRFLHSTGQLHKGGANNGVFIQITMKDKADPMIPGANYGFSTLKNAQALGDFQSLKDHGRRVWRAELSAQVAQDAAKLAKSLGKRKEAVAK